MFTILVKEILMRIDNKMYILNEKPYQLKNVDNSHDCMDFNTYDELWDYVTSHGGKLVVKMGKEARYVKSKC